MQSWPIRCLEFTPVALTFTLALTLTLIPSTLAQPGDLGPVDEEFGGCLPDQPCSSGFHVDFGMPDLFCNEKVDVSVASSRPSLHLEAVAEDVGGNQFVFKNTEPEDLLVVMVDPDVPSAAHCPQTYWLHWMALATLQDGNVDTSREIVEYQGPDPPPYTGVHRYQLLLFSLEGRETERARLVPPLRRNFDLQYFIESYGLDRPLASFQFRAED